MAAVTRNLKIDNRQWREWRARRMGILRYRHPRAFRKPRIPTLHCHRGAGDYTNLGVDGRWPMPLLRYFVFVGSALLGLIYLVGSVLTHDTPTHIDSKSEAPPPQRNRSTTLCSCRGRNPRCHPWFQTGQRRRPERRCRNPMRHPRRRHRTHHRARSVNRLPVNRSGRTVSRKPMAGGATSGHGPTGAEATMAGATIAGAMMAGATRVRAIRFGARTGAARAGVDSPASRQSLGRYPNVHPLGMIGIVRDA